MMLYHTVRLQSNASSGSYYYTHARTRTHGHVSSSGSWTLELDQKDARNPGSNPMQ